MNKFTKKGIAYKIIISLLIVITLVNVISPTVSHAAKSIYGVLFDPIQALLLGIGDAVMGIVNKIDTDNRISTGYIYIRTWQLVK